MKVWILKQILMPEILWKQSGLLSWVLMIFLTVIQSWRPARAYLMRCLIKRIRLMSPGALQTWQVRMLSI